MIFLTCQRQAYACLNFITNWRSHYKSSELHKERGGIEGEDYKLRYKNYNLSARCLNIEDQASSRVRFGILLQWCAQRWRMSAAAPAMEWRPWCSAQNTIALRCSIEWPWAQWGGFYLSAGHPRREPAGHSSAEYWSIFIYISFFFSELECDAFLLFMPLDRQFSNHHI